MRTSIVLFFALTACGEPSVAPQPKAAPAPAPVETPAPVEAPAPPEGHPEVPAAAAPGASVHRLGKVLEVLPVDERYTYARMDACGLEAWVAGPSAELEVGQTLVMEGGAVMENFESKTLKRTFDQLLMVNAWKLSDTEPNCSAAAMTPTPNAPAPAIEGEDDLSQLALGVATEVEVGAGYTFVKLEYCGEEKWVAGPQTPVKKGDSVGGVKPMLMKDFFAKSLGKKFPEISFIQKFKKVRALPPCKM